MTYLSGYTPDLNTSDLIIHICQVHVNYCKYTTVTYSDRHWCIAGLMHIAVIIINYAISIVAIRVC